MATIKDIAVAAGVSVSTVSVVLSGKSQERKISQKTQDNVWKVVRELDYQPNVFARRLRVLNSSDATVIAIFWATDFRASLMVRFLRGIQKRQLSLERNVEIIIHPYEAGRLCDVAALKGVSTFNAAIICNTAERDLAYLENADISVPIVLYNRHSKKFDTVNVDDERMGCLPAEIFAARGHRRVAVLAGNGSFPGSEKRLNAFEKAIASANIELSRIFFEEDCMAGGYEGGKKIVELYPIPDCVYCTSDALASGALRAFFKAGIRIPDNIEIICVGNGDKQMEEYMPISLSVVHLPMEDMAEKCLDLVLNHNDNHSGVRSVQLPIKYVARESCGTKPE